MHAHASVTLSEASSTRGEPGKSSYVFVFVYGVTCVEFREQTNARVAFFVCRIYIF